jgi:hypothetical protein
MKYPAFLILLAAFAAQSGAQAEQRDDTWHIAQGISAEGTAQDGVTAKVIPVTGPELFRILLPMVTSR